MRRRRSADRKATPTTWSSGVSIVQFTIRKKSPTQRIMSTPRKPRTGAVPTNGTAAAKNRDIGTQHKRNQTRNHTRTSTRPQLNSPRTESRSCVAMRQRGSLAVASFANLGDLLGNTASALFSSSPEAAVRAGACQPKQAQTTKGIE